MLRLSLVGPLATVDLSSFATNIWSRGVCGVCGVCGPWAVRVRPVACVCVCVCVCVCLYLCLHPLDGSLLPSSHSRFCLLIVAYLVFRWKIIKTVQIPQSELSVTVSLHVSALPLAVRAWSYCFPVIK